jgi:hypothetical protein
MGTGHGIIFMLKSMNAYDIICMYGFHSINMETPGYLYVIPEEELHSGLLKSCPDTETCRCFPKRGGDNNVTGSEKSV